MSKQYPISICMAGAVSAGAYSAGVMAELLNALRLWNDHDADLPFKPPHSVKVKGFSGASAGSIQAVLSSLDMLSGNPQQELGKSAWFDATLEKLLDVSDLTKAKKQGNLKSLLNSDSLQTIAKTAVAKHQWAEQWPAFVAQPLCLRLSVTNLRGVPFNIAFPKGNQTPFGMSTHNEYARYQIGNDLDLSADHHVVNFGDNGENTFQTLISGALASSAFPLVFSPVTLKRSSVAGKGYFNGYGWLDANHTSRAGDSISVEYKTTQRDPDWNPDYPPQDTIIAVDGGATNNEPIVEAFKVLFGDNLDDWRVPDDSKPGKVIMIDPFPNAVDKNITEETQRVDKSLGALISALMGQARFSEALMISENLQNRVGLVYPSLPNLKKGQLALRSGALGGFTGFLKPAFLHHDYALGRLNMRRFLRYHFTLPESDPLFDDWGQELKQQWRVSKPNQESALPIVPVYQVDVDDQYEIFENEQQHKSEFYDAGLRDLKDKFTRADRDKLSKQLNARLVKLGGLLLTMHSDFNNLNAKKKQKTLLDKITGFFGRGVKAVKNGLMKGGWWLLGAGYLNRAIIRTIEDALQQQEALDYKVKQKDQSGN